MTQQGGGKRKRKNIQSRSDNEYNITVKNPWFDFIAQGKKTVEGRLNRGLFKRINVGNIIYWINKNLKIKTIITYKKEYSSFKEMLQQEELSKVLPNKSSVDDGVAVYRQYYSQKDEEDGVVAIGLQITEHSARLQSPYYEFIRDGKKIYETRVYDEKRKNMKVGDIWIFTHNDNSELKPIRTVITEIKIYKSFREAIEDTGVEKLLPQIKDIEEGIKTYESFDNGNYKTDGEKMGVVRFTIKVIE
jgi:ASC-1-like (ASCH) protein